MHLLASVPMNGSGTMYERVHDYLETAIRRGDFAPGDMLPTDNELAARFEVSRPTVARAMANLKEAGVVERRPGYGTTVVNVPRDRQGHLTLGLLIPGLGETEIFEPICAKIASLAEARDFSLIWGGGGQAADVNRRNAVLLADRYIEQRVDGVFFTPVELIAGHQEINDHILNALEEASIPVVLLDRDSVPDPLSGENDLVGLDNRQAGYVVAEHLVARGCRSLGFVSHTDVANTVAIRIEGARRALVDAEMGSESFRLYETDADEQALADQLASARMPDGLICYNDSSAARLMQALGAAGVAVPDGVRIAGFDDVEYAKLLATPLTTYRQPCSEIGIVAVETMLSRISNPGIPPRKITLKGELIERRSTSRE